MHKDTEIAAIETCFQALESLSPEAQCRVLQWLNSRFQISTTQQESSEPFSLQQANSQGKTLSKNGSAELPETLLQKQELSSLLAIDNLQELSNYIYHVTESEKALLMAAYIQNAQHHAEVTSRTINDYLKKFDEGIKNITSALRVLTQKNPPLIIQTHKAGQVAQAQKKYQVTEAGFAYVNALLAQKLK